MKVVGQIVTINTTGGYMLCGLTYLVLLSMRILSSTVILGKACDLLDQHQKLLANDPDHEQEDASELHPIPVPVLR